MKIEEGYSETNPTKSKVFAASISRLQQNTEIVNRLSQYTIENLLTKSFFWLFCKSERLNLGFDFSFLFSYTSYEKLERTDMFGPLLR